MSHAGSTRAVERALGLLAEVATVGSVSLSEAARRAQLPTSTALRLLRTLEASGFVVRDPAGSFAAGPRLLQIGAYAVSRQSLVRLARPGMQRIVAATGETTYLSIAGPRDTAVYIGMVEGTHPVRHTSWVGQSMPSADLAVGQALAGAVPDEGYVAERDRSAPDVTAIAAPILRSGAVAGALSLLGPTYRIDEETMRSYGRIVSREAEAVASVLAGQSGNAGLGSPPGRQHSEEVTGP